MGRGADYCAENRARKEERMKALVTGGTGFIGSHVVFELLKEAHSVRVLSRRDTIPEQLKHTDIEIVKGNLEDFTAVSDAMDNTDVVYHIGEIKNSTSRAAKKNVKLMEHILKHFSVKGSKRLVFVSSITVAGIPSVLPADEDTKPTLVLQDHYTSYKRSCEEMLMSGAFRNEYVIVRPAPVFGPGSRYLGRLVNTIKYVGPVGLPFIGNARNAAPLIYVKDLARAIYLSGMIPEASGLTLNLTDGQNHSWFDFFNEIAGLLGKTLKILPLPPAVLKISALPLDLFTGFLGLELDATHYVQYFSRDLIFSNKQARAILGWEPRYTLQNAVKEMVASYTT
ncbi:MAG: NAD-dependent epimerase/dehydratase family protein [Nitrospiraceae bacterium]|nr:MAG: NAD-dependent epimerase/dehydratase family protein [Nitrospiraceae bacterium]